MIKSRQRHVIFPAIGVYFKKKKIVDLLPSLSPTNPIHLSTQKQKYCMTQKFLLKNFECIPASILYLKVQTNALESLITIVVLFTILVRNAWAPVCVGDSELEN